MRTALACPTFNEFARVTFKERVSSVGGCMLVDGAECSAHALRWYLKAGNDMSLISFTISRVGRLTVIHNQISSELYTLVVTIHR